MPNGPRNTNPSTVMPTVANASLTTGGMRDVSGMAFHRLRGAALAR